jgi:predicted unusual protein kinase regulating ubiquinone biosynthesis (AarF/ABC1/UbiB family)
VERLLRDAWDGKLSDHLADLERDPAAMASAGQVHRGELDDGRAVAVKVIHPGLEEAVRADLGNLGLPPSDRRVRSAGR